MEAEVFFGFETVNADLCGTLWLRVSPDEATGD